MRYNFMTFNIHHGAGIDGRVDLERIANVIHSSRANIVGLNEVDRHFSKRSGFVDQIQWLAQRLKMDYVFGPTIHHKYGNALLSDLRIQSFQNHVLFSSIPCLEQRSVLDAFIRIDDKQIIKVYITHLSLNPWAQQKQIHFILQQALSQRLPVIVIDSVGIAAPLVAPADNVTRFELRYLFVVEQVAQCLLGLLILSFQSKLLQACLYTFRRRNALLNLSLHGHKITSKDYVHD